MLTGKKEREFATEEERDKQAVACSCSPYQSIEVFRQERDYLIPSGMRREKACDTLSPVNTSIVCQSRERRRKERTKILMRESRE